MPGLQSKDALVALRSAATLQELKAIVRKVPAATSKEKLLLYAGFGKQTRTVPDAALAIDGDVGIIDQTERAEVLLDAGFQAKLGELCGVRGGKPATRIGDLHVCPMVTGGGDRHADRADQQKRRAAAASIPGRFGLRPG